MSLDPQVQAFLDQMASQPAPKIWEVPLSDARDFYIAMSAQTDPQDVPIGRTENLTFPGPGGDVPVRLYTPIAAGGGSLPALVYFHGGGWVIGNLESHDALCRLLANESGCEVVSIDYRLAPEQPFPAAVEDCFAAIKWIEENASSLDIDPNRIAVGGDSAGGNLAAVVTHLARKSGPKISFQLLIYPAVEALADTPSMIEFGEGYLLEREAMDWFVRQYTGGHDVKDPRISPLLAEDFSKLPPAYVITAQYDPLRDEGRMYADKLRAAGVEVTHIDYKGMIHGFFTMTGVLTRSREAVTDAAAALREALS